MADLLQLVVSQRIKNAVEEQKQASQEAAVRRALALQAFGGQPGTENLNPLEAVPGLQGVTDTTPPLAGLQQELANDRLEQQRQTALPDVTQLAQSVALARAGLDPSKMAAARTEALRGNLLADNAGALTPDARVNAANKQDVSPVRSEGGVFYDRFNREVPFIGMSEPAAALADSRWAASRASDARAGLSNAQQQTANLRLQALQEALNQPGLDPLMGADIANANTVAKPQRVKVKGEAGDVYYDALPKPGGGFDYRPATDAAGKPVAVPVSESGDAGTALQKDTAFISQVLNLPAQEAIRYKLESRGKGDQALRDDVSLRLLSDPRTGRLATTDPAKFNAQVDAVFKVLRPGQAVPPVPGPAAAPAAAAPAAARPAAQAAPAAPTPAGQDDPRYEEARAAVARGADPAKVRQRLQSMGLDPRRM
ncbi:MAG TPA: hypothetical protein VHN38_07495 [Immundisolibacter sp.]|nr:hypothetical protein [Immundisolibacter sp.]